MMHTSRAKPCSGAGQGNSWIMYQARMRYLKSREGGRPRGSGHESKRANGESASEEKSTSITAAHEPCGPEKLVPPLELMTRSRALRYTYWRHHEPSLGGNIDRLHFRKKGEDPLVGKKREEIFARIRAAEVAAVERKRRERDAKKRAERLRQQGSEPRMTRAPSDSEHESSNVDEIDIVDASFGRSRTSFGDDASCSSKEDDNGEFSFLSDWVNHKSIRWKNDDTGEHGRKKLH
mmetsp:Transcript_31292/g.93749  ORF Transcript_31292/g.93749 Transcript_31292/m.93749 type:complete len:235 (+) Transcript_31292:1554-2258(+)